MREFGVMEKELFVDKQSGKDFERPAYRQMLGLLRGGDTLAVKSIDRLGRNYEEIIEQWRMITKTIHAHIGWKDVCAIQNDGRPRSPNSPESASCVILRHGRKRKGWWAMAAKQSFKTNIIIPEAMPTPDENSSREELLALCMRQGETIAELTKQVRNLSESVEYLMRKLFGRSREKLPIPGQIDLFGNIWGDASPPSAEAPTGGGGVPPAPDEVLADSDPEEKPVRKPRPKRKDIFSNMETEKVTIPLSDDELTCQICGSQMEVIGEELAREEFRITPMQVTRVQYFRQTAACRNAGRNTAPSPMQNQKSRPP